MYLFIFAYYNFHENTKKFSWKLLIMEVIIVGWKRKLTSRKLWLSIASFVTMLMVYFGKDSGQAEQVASLIMAGATVIGYVLAEGLADGGNKE